MPRMSKKYRSKRKTYRKTRRTSTSSKGMLIKRTCALAPQIASGTAPDNVIWNQSSRSVGYFNFSLSDLPGNGEFTALFNRYKITGVSLRFIPIVGTSTDPGATTFMDTLAVQVDKSLRGVPANIDEILECGNARVFSAAAKPFKIWVSAPLAASTIAGSSALLTNPWLDSDANGIKHYGVRYAFASSLATASVRFQVYATYYLRLKGTK